MYKLLRNSESVVRLADLATIPADERNADRQAFVRWRDGWTERLEDDGTEVVHPPNVPEPADPEPAPTPDQHEAEAARAYPKLAAMLTGPRDDVLASIDAIANLAQARDVLKTLVIAIRALTRRL